MPLSFFMGEANLAIKVFAFEVKKGIIILNYETNWEFRHFVF